MSDKLRLFVTLGPGDIVGARRSRLAGEAVNETSIAFSEQLFAYCRSLNIQTLAISSNGRTDRLEDSPITLENRPRLLNNRGGVRFHLSLILYGFYLAIRARQFRADVAVIDSGTTHYFALVPFAVLGIPVAVNLHNVLWPRGYPPRGKMNSIIRFLNRLFFRYIAAGAIGVSPECERQVLTESRRRMPFFQYRCQFNAKGFQSSEPYRSGLFRIAFVGRAEENKGILDLTRIAAELRAGCSSNIVFEVCGDGPALLDLRTIIEQKRLTDGVIVHGRLERNELLSVYARCHAVIVPTRSNFTEGMPQVCAEAVLSGIPVITSHVTNAFDVIGPAIIHAETDDISSYVRAIQLLAGNQELYWKLRSACSKLAPQFLDRSQSYPAAIDRLLVRIIGTTPLPDYTKVFGEI